VRPRTVSLPPSSFAGRLKLEKGTKSRFFLNERKRGVFGKQASRASTNFRQTASIVSEWVPSSLLTPRQSVASSKALGRLTNIPALQRHCVSRSTKQQ
jgi:hypothetical protein